MPAGAGTWGEGHGGLGPLAHWASPGPPPKGGSATPIPLAAQGYKAPEVSGLAAHSCLRPMVLLAFCWPRHSPAGAWRAHPARHLPSVKTHGEPPVWSTRGCQPRPFALPYPPLPHATRQAQDLPERADEQQASTWTDPQTFAHTQAKRQLASTSSSATARVIAPVRGRGQRKGWEALCQETQGQKETKVQRQTQRWRVGDRHSCTHTHTHTHRPTHTQGGIDRERETQSH